MGKKGKVGKARKDKFYHLAKESGYRSRAAFKLIQLNRTHEFLQRSRVLIDLCAAPGGWLQVAKQFMPVSSIILGIDLVPIKSVPNVITLQEDITTDSCRSKIRHELKTWKADVVLHDGAPNVGKNWLHDAFTQARLTLSAFKLATDFLAKNGWFITKIFRSRDYHALLWVFQQFFRKVVATKPPASRNESAEIFVVCSGYLGPDKIDPKLLDPKHVFEEVDVEDEDEGDTTKKRTVGAAKLNLLMNPAKKKKSSEGYADGKVLLQEKLPARSYINAAEDKSKELLSQCHEIIIDDEDKSIAGNSATTDEIRECCADIKVLGKRELRLIINWRKKILAAEEAISKKLAADSTPAVSIKPLDEEDEDAAIQRQIEKVKEDERLDARRKRKRLNKLRQQLTTKMNLKMVIPGDALLQEEEQGEHRLFALDAIKSAKGLAKVAGEDVSMDVEQDDEDEDKWNEAMAEEDNPLLLGRESTKQRKERMMKEWFNKDIFTGVDFTGGKKEKRESERKTGLKMGTDESDSDWEDEDDGLDGGGAGELEYDVISELKDEDIKKEEDVAPEDEKPIIKLDPEGFALAEELIKSKKRRREIVEAGFHREAFNEPDDELPPWFVDDEKKFCRRSLVDQGLVTKEQVKAHKEQLKAIDARPIKKVAEARARKKNRMVKRLEKARKKASNVLSSEGPVEMSSQEKMSQLKAIYKKAGALGKKKTLAPTYVVSKRGGGTNKPHDKPVKGSRVKVVDRRMKKDLRAAKSAAKRDKKGGKAKKEKTGARGGRAGQKQKKK
ncbi:pre-rRNA processing protein FTSJ3 [Hypsibius exemplaris]|uniref:Putative rRNA methyltransferase n=1 Tax=Hypsibius exemplaris TaxID=2072580 RepID=A0A1W0WWS6_HYPEX|nr:pre-rRNA processing protein FTSJ3 [Hypsibius exemplaris]